MSKKIIVKLLFIVLLMTTSSISAYCVRCYICLDSYMDRKSGLVYCGRSGNDQCCAQVECALK